MDFKKGATKHCFFDGCVSDSRYGPKVDFISFRKPCLAVRRNLIVGDKNHIKRCDLCQVCYKWLQICKRNIFRDITSVNRNTFLCSNHFVDKTGPTKMYPDPLPSTKVIKIRQSQRNRVRKRSSVESSAESLITANNITTKKKAQHTSICNATNDNPIILQIDDVILVNQTSDSSSDQSNKSLDHSLQPEVQLENLRADLKIATTKFRESSSQTCSELNKTAAVQTTFSYRDFQTLKDEIDKLKKTIKFLKKKIDDMERATNMNKKSQKVTEFVESLKINDKKCKFYTNLYFTQILALFAFLQPTDNLRYWNTKKAKSPLKKTLLSPFEELILTLVRLRTGLLLDDLSYRFNISKNFISSTIITWVQHSFYKFDKIRPSMFATREKIKENLPAMFKRLKNIRVIIDCAEFFCQVPSNFEQQGNLYSSYKAHTTFKVLLGCTPNGAVSFVSNLFEGSISDKDIVRKSKLIEYLEPGDLVLADRGFDIKDLTDPKKVALNIPPFLKGRDRLTAEEEIETKNIAKERIYVEHVVGRLKQFRLLKKTLPLNMRGILEQIVFVCACLLNFQQPILEKEPS